MLTQAKARPWEGKREAKWRPKGGQGRPRGRQREANGTQKGAKRTPRGGQKRPRGGQKETQGGQGEAKGGQGRKRGFTFTKPAPLPHHFGTQNPTQICQKSLKNGFKNNAEYKYVFSLVLAPKHSQNPPQNHLKIIKNQ